MSLDADVIVAGAGPAGSTAAKLLADRGYSVLLIDRAVFPRHKTCASWINRLAFERFPYLNDRLHDLVENAFYGVTFYDRTVGRSASFNEKRPSGYLSLRSKFDEGLRRIAIAAGAEFIGGCGVSQISEERDSIRVQLADGRQFGARVLIGADGASSRVAVSTGLRRAWGRRDYVLCANTDVPLAPEKVIEFFREKFPLLVYLEFNGIQGYGWVFPKFQHVCIGIGALLENGRMIRPLFERFVQVLREHGHIPSGLLEEKVYFDIDPVGAVYQMPSLVRGRAMLIGDAAGMVSGSTGEGIYPGMASADIAAEVIHRALRDVSPASVLKQFNRAWRTDLGNYVKRLPGGQHEGKTRSRIDMIFRVPVVSRIAARAFLYGEQPSIGMFLRFLWPYS